MKSQGAPGSPGSGILLATVSGMGGDKRPSVRFFFGGGGPFFLSSLAKLTGSLAWRWEELNDFPQIWGRAGAFGFVMLTTATARTKSKEPVLCGPL